MIDLTVELTQQQACRPRTGFPHIRMWRIAEAGDDVSGFQALWCQVGVIIHRTGNRDIWADDSPDGLQHTSIRLSISRRCQRAVQMDCNGVNLALDSFQAIQTPAEGEEFLLKPMNCPHHCEIYNSKPWSYKELPKRFAEFGTVYRYEQSGELHGLTRVRGFTQDDAHIFCMPDQLDQEFKNVIDLVLYVFGSLGFENFTAQVSLRDPKKPEKYIGSDENWEKAEQAILNAAKSKELNYVVEYGEAAFYGPKLDFMVKDALGRNWQLGTIQVDYNLPERFDLTYKGSDNGLHRPVMIHRAPFGSMERFVAILLEHTGGNFPLWLTPSQVIILPVGEKYEKYAQKVLKSLENHEIRALIDCRNETVGKKIREAEMNKTPYMIIIGEKEASEETLSLRKHGGEDMGMFTEIEFVKFIEKEVNKTLKTFN